MAKGSVSKEKVAQKILELFPEAFAYEKEIRVPMIEDGAEVQIKVTLTCAKNNVERNGDTALPGDFPAPVNQAPAPMNTAPAKPTDAEKQTVADLLKSLGL